MPALWELIRWMAEAVVTGKFDTKALVNLAGQADKTIDFLLIVGQQIVELFS